MTTGEKKVSDLAEPFDMTMPAITKHLNVMEKANLVTRSRQAQYRPCRLHPVPLRDIDKWMEQYRQFFERSFERLDSYLKKIQIKKENDDGNKN